MTSLLARGGRRNTSAGPTAGPDHVRTLLRVAFRPTGVAIVLICTAVLVTLVSSNSDLAGAVGAIAASWLAVHQVSLTVAGAPLAILPLLPTMLMVWAVARGCARAVTSDAELRDAGRVVAAAVAGPIAVTLVAVAVVSDAAAVTPLESPNVPTALASVLGIHLVGACAGIVSTLGPSLSVRWGLPGWVAVVARPAVRATGLLFAAGAAVTAASLVWSWSEVGDLLGGDFGFVGLLGSTVLAVLYLPNVAVGAVAVLVGGTAHAGGASVSVFDVVPGAVPPVPILGGVPTELVGGGWPILLAVPVVVGALLGRDCGRLRLSVGDTTYVVASAAAAVGVVAALVGFLAGGDLGSYGFVGVEPVALGAVTFGWLVVPGLVVGALIARGHAGEPDGDGTDGEPGHSTVTEGSPAVGAVPREDAVDFEVKRLERPTVRYRAAADPELEAAPSATTAEPAAEDAPAPASAEIPDVRDVIEAEIVEEPATPTVDGPDDSAVVEAEPVAEGDLPDGPKTPSD